MPTDYLIQDCDTTVITHFDDNVGLVDNDLISNPEQNQANTQLRFHSDKHRTYNNDNEKVPGNIALQDAKFVFIGPDKPLHKSNSIQQNLRIADVIVSTGLPNYR